MFRAMLFGRGEISSRLVFEGWRIGRDYESRTSLIGWQAQGHCFDLWVRLIPFMPIHFSCWYHDPHQ